MAAHFDSIFQLTFFLSSLSLPHPFTRLCKLLAPLSLKTWSCNFLHSSSFGGPNSSRLQAAIIVLSFACCSLLGNETVVHLGPAMPPLSGDFHPLYFSLSVSDSFLPLSKFTKQRSQNKCFPDRTHWQWRTVALFHPVVDASLFISVSSLVSRWKQMMAMAMTILWFPILAEQFKCFNVVPFTPGILN